MAIRTMRCTIIWMHRHIWFAWAVLLAGGALEVVM